MENNKVVDEIYQYVVNQILDGTYTVNYKLSERLIGEIFGTSRTVVREAFFSLKNNGWINVTSKSGTYVAPYDNAAVIANYELRMYIEPQILLMAYPNFTEDDLLFMKQQCEIMRTGTYKDYCTSETKLHGLLPSKSNNQYLVSFYATLTEGMLRAGSTNISTKGHRSESVEDWLEIIHQLEVKNPYMASKLLQRHILNSYRFFKRVISADKLGAAD